MVVACDHDDSTTHSNGPETATIAALEYALHEWPQLNRDTWLMQRVARDELAQAPLDRVAAYTGEHHPHAIQEWAVEHGMGVCAVQGVEVCPDLPEGHWNMVAVSSPSIGRDGSGTLRILIASIDDHGWSALGYQLDLRRDRQGDWAVTGKREVYHEN